MAGRLSSPKLGGFFGRSKNPIETSETTRNVGSGFAKDVAHQTEPLPKDFFAQLLGLSEKKSEKSPSFPKGGEMKPGEIISFSKATRVESFGKSQDKVKTPEKQKNLNILPGIDYRREILYGSEQISSKENKELEQKVTEIMVELKRLVDSTSTLEMQFRAVSMDRPPVTVGKYHVNFLEWVIITIKSARMKVEDSGAWLSVMSSKKGERQYGKMAKKFGTSFSLSSERTTATQTG